MKIPELSIVIPCYNEEKRLDKNFYVIYNYCLKNIKKFEIILVDDGSTDSTPFMMMKHHDKNIKFITYTKNMGKGYAVKQGIMRAQYKHVLFMDIDSATPINEIEKLYPYVNKYNVVIGSREIEDSNIIVQQPISRKVMGWVFRKMYYIILGLKIRDTQNGFKLFETSTAQFLFSQLTTNRWAFDIEILYLYIHRVFPSCKIKEVGITWINDKDSRVNPIKDGIQMFIALLQIRFRHG